MLDSRLMMFGDDVFPEFAPLTLTPEFQQPSVVREERVVVVTGDLDGQDDIRLVLGEDGHVLTVEGTEYRYDAAEVDHFMFDMNSFYPANLNSETDVLLLNRDELKIVGSRLDDKFVVHGNELTVTSSEYSVRVHRGARKTRVVGAGGNDTLKFYDTAFDDSVFMHHNYTTFVTSGGNTIKASGVERVQAYAKNGGYDRVRFYDTDGNDRFVGKQDFSFWNGDGFSNYANGFERVDAFHRAGGTDEAILYDSPGDDHLTAEPHRVHFQVGDTLLVTHGFRETRAFASEGNDTANLHGEAHTKDSFVWEPGSAFMHTKGQGASQLLFDFEQDAEVLRVIDRGVAATKSTNYAVGFDLVRGIGNDDSGDRAELRGSAGDDFFRGNARNATFATSVSNSGNPSLGQTTVSDVDAGAIVVGFEMLRAFGRGGFDHAELIDGHHNDHYVSNEKFAFMRGYGGGGISNSIPPATILGRPYLNYVEDFGMIDARFDKGGFDTVNVAGYGEPGNEALVLDGPQFLIWRTERDELVTGFRGYSSAILTGNDASLVIERGPTAPITLKGSHMLADLAEEELGLIRGRLEDGGSMIDLLLFPLEVTG